MPAHSFTGLKTTGAALAACMSLSTSAHGDEVDRYLQAQIRALHIPGLSLAVVRDGTVVKAAGYGFANLELEARATPQTVYEIGSLTKQFTAAAVLLLVEEGRIDLEDPIRRYLPEAPDAWGRLSVRHLLTHTAGIQNHVAVPGWTGVFKTSLLGETTPARDELLRMFFELPFEFEPGETWAYDNTGYYLLGVIVERVSGKRLWQFRSR
jgi:CubicO group peptidase (beta-lactamase class C family)